MSTTPVTKVELRRFKRELLDDIKQLLLAQDPGRIKKYLKSPEVVNLLQISPGTLQHLRNNGTLPFIKIGGVIYYDPEDIHSAMIQNQVHHLKE
jgi:predicted DNA-binding transcriptional regulator AlpA